MTILGRFAFVALFALPTLSQADTLRIACTFDNPNIAPFNDSLMIKASDEQGIQRVGWRGVLLINRVSGSRVDLGLSKSFSPGEASMRAIVHSIAGTWSGANFGIRQSQASTSPEGEYAGSITVSGRPAAAISCTVAATYAE